DDVRSLSLPKIGLPNMANSAPVPATSARLLGACWIPTSEFTFNARVTSTGARNSRLVLMKASVYSAMKLHPTRSAAGESSSKMAAATSGGSRESAVTCGFHSVTVAHLDTRQAHPSRWGDPYQQPC